MTDPKEIDEMIAAAKSLMVSAMVDAGLPSEVLQLLNCGDDRGTIQAGTLDKGMTAALLVVLPVAMESAAKIAEGEAARLGAIQYPNGGVANQKACAGRITGMIRRRAAEMLARVELQ
jgi:hypothetical protein